MFQQGAELMEGYTVAAFWDVPETLENDLLGGLKLKPNYSSDFTSG